MHVSPLKVTLPGAGIRQVKKSRGAEAHYVSMGLTTRDIVRFFG
jgi:hypothetical protein